MIVLNGLDAGVPVGFMAAVGLLRVLARTHDTARLSFTLDDRAVITGVPFDMDELLAHLAVWVHVRTVTELPRLKTSLGKEAHYHKRSREEWASLLCDMDELLIHLASDVSWDGEKLARSAFDMASGQQRFVEVIHKSFRCVDAEPRAKLQEALLGPWTFQDKVNMIGWDPSTENLKAYQGDVEATGVPGVMCLASEALSAFPVFPASTREVATTGFHCVKDNMAFIWPLWSDPLSEATVRALLQHADLPSAVQDAQAAYQLRNRGVHCLFVSQRAKINKHKSTLRMPRRIDL